MRVFFSCLIIVFAGGCASRQQALQDAAGTPLTDLNIVRQEIPAPLVQASDNPYFLPNDLMCVSIFSEIRELDLLLPADFDAPKSVKDDSLLNKGSDTLAQASVDAVKRTASDIIPFRSWIRKLTGAERHSDLVKRAILAGNVRRAFLKGVASAQRCYVEPPQENSVPSALVDN